jgi:hypothetical protein
MVGNTYDLPQSRRTQAYFEQSAVRVRVAGRRTPVGRGGLSRLKSFERDNSHTGSQQQDQSRDLLFPSAGYQARRKNFIDERTGNVRRLENTVLLKRRGLRKRDPVEYVPKIYPRRVNRRL